MSEFVDALTEAVEAGSARGRLPGAADAMRRGRRRSLRARGGAAALGVVALGGVLGIGSVFGTGSRTAPAGPAAGQWGAHADDGILPVAQWPGYDLAHWTLSASCGAADRKLCKPGAATDAAVKTAKAGEWTGQCEPGSPFPVRRFVQYGTQYDEGRRLDADEIVFTFPDRDTAAAFLASARTAGAKVCSADPEAEIPSPGVSTADGISLLMTQHAPNLTGYTHTYLVQVDDRVALLRVNQIGAGDTLRSTAGDETVLQNLAAALSR